MPQGEYIHANECGAASAPVEFDHGDEELPNHRWRSSDVFLPESDVDPDLRTARAVQPWQTAAAGRYGGPTPGARYKLAPGVDFADGQRFSVTVVRGCRAAVAPVTYRPVTALRCAVPDERFRPPASVTLVRGCRAAAARLM